MSTAFQHRPLTAFLVPEDGKDPRKSQTSKAEADSKQESRAADAPEIPEKYRGKSVEEVIEMHRNAERRLGEVQNELGVSRGIINDLANLRRSDPSPKPEEQEQALELRGDDLIENPVEAIRKVVQHDNAKKEREQQLKEAEDALARETQSLYEEYPNLNEVVGSEKFAEWANRKPSRMEDLQIAANGSGIDQIRAARRLLDNYTDAVEVEKTKPKETPVERARKVATERSASSGNVTPGEVFYQDQLVELIVKDPAKWRSPSFQRSLREAIREGRYVPSA